MHRWVVGIATVAIVQVAEAAPNRTIQGVVVNEVTGEPVAEANVTTRHGTIATAGDGLFSVVAAADDTELFVTAPGYVMKIVKLTDDDTIRITLSPAHELIEVSGTLPVVEEPVERNVVTVTHEPAAASTYKLSADDLRMLPGTANDALRAAQVLPGVARLPFSFGGVVLRGAAPRDSVVYLDGVEVPLAFHFGGVTSFYPSGMLADLTVKNSGLDADYGRAAGGMISLTSREPRTDRWRTGGSVGLLDSAIFAEGPIQKGGVLIGLRRSYFDIVAGPVAADDTPMPSYWDLQVRSSFGDPKKLGRIAPTMFFALDHMTRTEPGRDNYENETALTSMFIRVAMPYDRRWGPTTLRITPWVGTNQLAFRSRVNGVTERFERPLYPGGLRTEVKRETGWGEVRGGLDMQGGYLTNYQSGLGHSGDILEQVNGETEISWMDAAVWADTRYRYERLTVKPGLRVDRYGLSDETVIDPRLSLSVNITDTLLARGTVGRYHQPPTAGDVDPNGGNPRLQSSYSDSASLGIDGELGDGWSGGVALWYSKFENVGVRLGNDMTDFHNLGGLGNTFSLLLEKQLGLAFYRENIGKGRSGGLELLVKRVTPVWTWLLAYTLSKSERTDDPALHMGWRPFELDQRHNVNVAVSRVLGSWRFGARVRYVSGMPYSPVMGQTIEGEPILDPYGGQLPYFFQFDLRVDRLWQRCWGAVDLYFDIQNISNRRNIEGREPDDFNVTDQDIRGLPIMPFIGVEFIPS